jgi:hypothetical protein
MSALKCNAVPISQQVVKHPLCEVRGCDTVDSLIRKMMLGLFISEEEASFRISVFDATVKPFFSQLLYHENDEVVRPPEDAKAVYLELKPLYAKGWPTVIPSNVTKNRGGVLEFVSPSHFVFLCMRMVCLRRSHSIFSLALFYV